MFIIGETINTYEMFHVSLDTWVDPYNKTGQIIDVIFLMNYPKHQINDAHLLDFHVRSGNNKNYKITNQKNIIAFFLHEGYML